MAAQDAEALRLFDTHIQVRFEGQPKLVDGTTAQGQKDAADAAAAHRGQATTTLSSLPTDVFKVWVVKVNTLDGWEVGGHWKFANYFAGQTDPGDVATLEFDINKCAKLQHLDMATDDTSGKSTKLGSLHDANFGANAPIWNVEDKEKGSGNQADSGAALAWLNADSCKKNHNEARGILLPCCRERGSRQRLGRRLHPTEGAVHATSFRDPGIGRGREHHGPHADRVVNAASDRASRPGPRCREAQFSGAASERSARRLTGPSAHAHVVCCVR